MDKGESNINLEIVPRRKALRPVNHLEKRCLALRSSHLSVYLLNRMFHLVKTPKVHRSTGGQKNIAVEICVL